MHVLQKILFILLLQWVTLQSTHSLSLIALNRRILPGGPNARNFFTTSPPRTEREESAEVHQITALPVDHLRCQKILVLRVTALDCSCTGEVGAKTTTEGLIPVQILVRNLRVLIEAVVQSLGQIQLCISLTVNKKWQ